MSNPSSANQQPIPAPVNTLPADQAIVGSRTIFMGTGAPTAFIEVRDSKQQQSYGEGYVNKNARWVFSAKSVMLPGNYQIQTRQTLNNETSAWSAPRSFTVVVPMKIEAPEIAQPQEGEQTDASPVFSGKAYQNGGAVDLFDMNANQLLVSASVLPDGSWRTQALQPLPVGEHRISALHRVAGDVSDWALLRTFSVRVSK
ncbi:hypothetical protein [Pseudomonas gozinkensis]|uniref:hypothetical protein n=1 Tax=Pseudomonas gozinkensis TaxID=2774461 RepID=UPI001788488F|nr:hypothetical protein [Pseudomonas gozinkensis]